MGALVLMGRMPAVVVQGLRAGSKMAKTKLLLKFPCAINRKPAEYVRLVELVATAAQHDSV